MHGNDLYKQLIFIKKGEEKAFHEFERIVIPLPAN